MIKTGDIVNVASQHWRKKKISEKDLSYQLSNEAMLLETHVSMFEYINLPKSVNKYFLELYLQTQGCVVWLDAPDNGGILAIEGCTTDDLDAYGIGRNVIATTRNGKEYNLERDADCVVGYNNLTMTGCMDIFTDAQTLADIQTSIDFLIFWTRLSPLVRVSDEKLKLKVIDAFKNIQRGIPVTIASKKVLADFGIPDDITIDMLTQPDFADKIQYTAKLYDDVLRWHMTRYGHATNGNSKMAQQTVDEVDSTVSQSMILPLSMLAARKEMIDYEEMSGEGNIDGTPDDSAAPAEDSTDNDMDTPDTIDTNVSEQAAGSEGDETDSVEEAAGVFADAIVEAAAEVVANVIKEGGEDDQV